METFFRNDFAILKIVYHLSNSMPKTPLDIKKTSENFHFIIPPLPERKILKFGDVKLQGNALLINTRNFNWICLILELFKKNSLTNSQSPCVTLH